MLAVVLTLTLIAVSLMAAVSIVGSVRKGAGALGAIQLELAVAKQPRRTVARSAPVLSAAKRRAARPSSGQLAAA